MDDRPSLGQRVGAPGSRAGESGRTTPAPRPDDEISQQDPRRSQGQVVSLPHTPGGPKRARDECSIIEADNHRSGDHHLFGGHAEQAGQEREREPKSVAADRGGARWGVRRSPAKADPQRACFARDVALRVGDNALHPPNKTIQRQQIKQSHQRLGPLHDIGDRFRLQRMHRPEQRGGASEDVRRRAPPLAERRLQESPAHNPVKGQAGQQVHQQIEEVIAARIHPAQGVVQRQRKIEHRAPSHRARLRAGRK